MEVAFENVYILIHEIKSVRLIDDKDRIDRTDARRTAERADFREPYLKHEGQSRNRFEEQWALAPVSSNYNT